MNLEKDNQEAFKLKQTELLLKKQRPHLAEIIPFSVQSHNRFVVGNCDVFDTYNVYFMVSWVVGAWNVMNLMMWMIFC